MDRAIGRQLQVLNSARPLDQLWLGPGGMHDGQSEGHPFR